MNNFIQFIIIGMLFLNIVISFIIFIKINDNLLRVKSLHNYFTNLQSFNSVRLNHLVSVMTKLFEQSKRIIHKLKIEDDLENVKQFKSKEEALNYLDEVIEKQNLQKAE